MFCVARQSILKLIIVYCVIMVFAGLTIESERKIKENITIIIKAIFQVYLNILVVDYPVRMKTELQNEDFQMNCWWYTSTM